MLLAVRELRLFFVESEAFRLPHFPNLIGGWTIRRGTRFDALHKAHCAKKMASWAERERERKAADARKKATTVCPRDSRYWYVDEEERDGAL